MKITVNGFITPTFVIPPFPPGSGSVGSEDINIDVIGAPTLVFQSIASITPATLNQKITVTNADDTANPSFQPAGYDTFSNSGSGITLTGISGLGYVRRFQPAASKINAQGGGVWSAINC